jgi:UPF0042 nucleotide-binding protein
VLKFLEDAGFFCVDNLPPALISKFAEVCSLPGSEIKQVALGIDARGAGTMVPGSPSGTLFEELISELKNLSVDNFQYTILFLDASDETLVKRYKETRHSHPLAKNERVIFGIEKEREFLHRLKKQADFIVDTSNTLTRQLKDTINEIIIKNTTFNSLIITVLSFGFKYGIPDDSDLVFDVRFMPNPFYITEMRELTGKDAPVRDFVMKSEISRQFHEKLLDLVTFLIPHYVDEGKNQLIISIGCTGGKHRSVTLAEALYSELKEDGFATHITHRDIDKDAKRY